MRHFVPALVFCVFTTASASAALTNGTNGAGKGTVIDTVNQTEWLDIDETTGLSPNQALAANPGYRWATFDDMQAVLDQYFIINPPEPATFVLANNNVNSDVSVSFSQSFGWLDLFEFHANDPGFSAGYLDDGVDDGNQDFFTFGVGSGTPFISLDTTPLNGTPDGDLFNTFRGTYLVRDIPEPTSLALLGLGGLLVSRRRR